MTLTKNQDQIGTQHVESVNPTKRTGRSDEFDQVQPIIGIQHGSSEGDSDPGGTVNIGDGIAPLAVEKGGDGFDRNQDHIGITRA